VDEEAAEVQVDFDGLDVFAADDVCNLGGGMPLFKEFLFEDWTLMSLRYELYLLVQAFRKDCGDPERAGIHIDHLSFYYNKYYKIALNPRYFGVETFTDIVGLVKDAIYLTKQQVLDTQLPGELETFGVFAKLAEEARRYRNLQLDLGEASARINIQQAYGHQKGGFEQGKGQKRGWQGDRKGDGKFDQGKKGFNKGAYQPQGPAVPYQVPMGKDGKGIHMKGQTKGYGGVLPALPPPSAPPPPAYVQAPYVVSYAKGKDAGKGKDAFKGKDNKGGFDNRKGGFGGHDQFKGAPDQFKGGNDFHKGGFEQKGAKDYGKGGFEQKGGKDRGFEQKGGGAPAYGKSYDKGGYGKGGGGGSSKGKK